jgi:hypothetical protein
MRCRFIHDALSSQMDPNGSQVSMVSDLQPLARTASPPNSRPDSSLAQVHTHEQGLFPGLLYTHMCEGLISDSVHTPTS